MEYIVLLRGVTPTGKNSIPKMSYLADILTEIGFRNVRTYIQSGNIILESELSISKIESRVHDIIVQKIGADLKCVIKTKAELQMAAATVPYTGERYIQSRIHLTFCNERMDSLDVSALEEDFGDEKLTVGQECFYLYLPRDAKKKRLNTNFLEKRLQTIMTTRKLSVVTALLSK